MFYALVSSDFVRSDSVEQFVLLSNRESICVHPGSPSSLEALVKIRLAGLLAFHQFDIGQLS